MPEFCLKDDHKFIREQLLQLPFSKRDRVARLYSQAFQEAYDGEVIAYRKEGIARRNANTRLRNYVTKFRAVTSGSVRKPPQVFSQGQEPSFEETGDRVV
ncbi:hypothetical protein [Rodentibacter pneumotropicus]|nr:hypothetical protein [Rodentibacter pneumotropicus]